MPTVPFALGDNRACDAILRLFKLIAHNFLTDVRLLILWGQPIRYHVWRKPSAKILKLVFLWTNPPYGQRELVLRMQVSRAQHHVRHRMSLREIGCVGNRRRAFCPGQLPNSFHVGLHFPPQAFITTPAPSEVDRSRCFGSAVCRRLFESISSALGQSCSTFECYVLLKFLLSTNFTNLLRQSLFPVKTVSFSKFCQKSCCNLFPII